MIVRDKVLFNPKYVTHAKWVEPGKDRLIVYFQSGDFIEFTGEEANIIWDKLWWGEDD